MKLCFNEATTLENSNLEKDLELCEKHGYDYIEIRWMDKLPEYLETHTLEDLKNDFASRHIKPLALNALVFFNNRDDEEAVIKEFTEMAQTGKELGVEYLVTVPLVTGKAILKQDIKNSAVRMLREFSKIAEDYELKVALEFVGHPECTINTFNDAYEVVQEVDRENIGLVMDCFHLYAMGSRVEDLAQADGTKIFIVHIDDTEDYPVGCLRDEHRVWPGRGILPLQKVFATLKDIGFPDEGVVSVELFRPEYYAMDAEAVIQKAKQTTLEAVSSYYSTQPM
ncbi:sugar phosphate isomerase/epimerase [Halobacillus salinarum]|uniref:Sugar phosphate isomerase/epimerase n=1 Tax=Halobacillus salinarum TaxID=2932257 RepID=A0ABY4ENN6_9BACI|nr:sugar phosphate isomerase/epimerase [Halobacillus salinarum]UOQ45552.1 sugar phosphate isomerase/epimerase [Halobacillus salinarum]